MTVYKSKVSYGLFLPIMLLPGILAGHALWQRDWVSLCIQLFVLAIIVHLLFTTSYKIDGMVLRVRCSLLKIAVPVESIDTIESTNSVLSAPALSPNRLRLRTSSGVVVISPRHQMEFIAELLHLNPGIKVA